MDTNSVSGFLFGGLVCFGIVFVIIIGLAILSNRREKERRGALAQWAAYHGWTMTLRPEVDWSRRLPGRNRRGVTLALSGIVDGRPVTIAEYQFTETTTSSSTDAAGSTSSSTTHRYVLLVVRMNRPGPSIGVYRRGSLSKFGRSLFGDRATATGHEPFDREYRVAAPDARVVPSVLRPALVQEQSAGHLPDWSLEGQDLLTYYRGRIDDPATIPGQFGPLLRVASLLES